MYVYIIRINIRVSEKVLRPDGMILCLCPPPFRSPAILTYLEKHLQNKKNNKNHIAMPFINKCNVSVCRYLNL